MTGQERDTHAYQRCFEDVTVGDEVNPVSFPLPVYRLVMEAGANRDFNSIHHNSEYARQTGADEMYANVSFLLGMWERTVRQWIGNGGTIRSITGFRMRSFNYAGDTTTVYGKVVAVDAAAVPPTVTLEVHSANSTGVTVGPGQVMVTLPSADAFR
jgi:acyl dehydratase